MKEQVKNWLTIALKNAINAVLASGILKVLIDGSFHMNSQADWWNFGKSLLSVIIAREVVVWGPILLAWSSTSSNPKAELKGGGIVVPPHP